MNLPQKNDQNALAKLFGPEKLPDTVSAWAEIYFRIEVTTSARSRREQQRDLQLFIDFLFRTIGKEDRLTWTPRLSRAFMEYLQKETVAGKRRWSDRTINRVLAHLKTFAKWVHKHQPFPLGNPMEKIGLLKVAGVLDVERALTEAERRKLLDAADYLPVTGGRSKDRRRHGKLSADQRPQRKGYRPWRNRAIIYTLVETGMRRAEVTSIDLLDVDVKRSTVRIIQKGGQQHRCQISKEGMRAIQDYIDKERAGDAARWSASPALFLPAASVAKSAGRLAPVNINTIMAEVCRLAGITDRTPHSARHGMGVHIIKKTGNPRAVQRQLGHTNPSTSMQYMQFTQEELQAVLDER